MKITDLSAVDCRGVRTITGCVDGTYRSVSESISVLSELTQEQAQMHFIGHLLEQIESEPKPYDLGITSITL